MSYTDDPIQDFLNHDAEQTRRLEKLPKCSYCGKHIQNDYYYIIDDDNICPGCLDREFKVYNEEY